MARPFKGWCSLKDILHLPLLLINKFSNKKVLSCGKPQEAYRPHRNQSQLWGYSSPGKGVPSPVLAGEYPCPGLPPPPPPTRTGVPPSWDILGYPLPGLGYPPGKDMEPEAGVPTRKDMAPDGGNGRRTRDWGIPFCVNRKDTCEKHNLPSYFVRRR